MHRHAILVLAFFILLLAAGPRSATAQPTPQRAPEIDRPDPGTGFVPPTQDLSHIAPPAIDPAKARDLAARFDWRTAGHVSPAKDQGSCGACYAFAAAGDVEAQVLRDSGVLVDLSENYLKECHYEARSCNGGNAQMVVNLLSLRGAVLEECDPYQAADVACDLSCAPAFSVLDWIWISGSEQPVVADLKQALLDHGPLSTTVYAGDASNATWWNAFGAWNGGDGLFYDGSEINNHAVMLVGWDDDQPHTGGGTGCWIVKNSWGEDWGDACGHGTDAGFFYIAYGSAGIGQWSSVVVELMSSYPGLAVMAWDEGGWTSSYGYSQTSAWGLGRFDADHDTYLHRVEFWTTDVTVDVDVFVYDSFDGTSLSGLFASQENLSFDAAGYHSVALDDPLPFIEGNDYYVAIRYQNASYGYPVAVDAQGARGPGHTWLSYNGANWTDLGGTSSCEAGIRVRTSPHTTLPIDDPAAPDLPPVPAGVGVFELDAPWPNPFNPSTGLSFTLGRAASVHLRIYDLQGRLVRTLVDDDLGAGRHSVRWSGRDDAGRSVPAGVYLGRLDDGFRWRSRRMVLVK